MTDKKAALQALIDEGLHYSEALLLFYRALSDEERAYITKAYTHPLVEGGVLEVDSITMVSPSDDGAYVQVWLYIPDEEDDD
jgi:hypothetical protein